MTVSLDKLNMLERLCNADVSNIHEFIDELEHECNDERELVQVICVKNSLVKFKQDLNDLITLFKKE